MPKLSKYTCLIFAVSILALSAPSYAELERKDLKETDTWKLEDIYASPAAWRKAKETLAPKIDNILSFKGKISRSPAQLLKCLEFDSELSKEFSRLYSYAQMRSDEDTRISKYVGMTQELQYLLTDFRSKSSFIEPEICSMKSKTVKKFIAKESGLSVYKVYLDNIQRTKKHKLSEKEEKLLAQASLITNSSKSIFDIFSNAELPFPQVTLSDGKTVTLSKSGYSRYRNHPNRQDREKVFNAFWQLFDDFKQTFGAQLNANVKKNIFLTKARNYDTVLERALDRNNIPVKVYLTLIDNVNKNLNLFHRYITIKKRILGLETIKYSDMYVLGVEKTEDSYSYEKASELILEAVEPLGKPYVEAVRKSITDRWIDIYPTTGKKSGAYCNGSAYDVHPYMLLNYNGQYDDVSTMAHELGHAIHSYFTNNTQPYPTSHYSIFVAEVASTFNEMLLIDKILKESNNDDRKLFLLLSYLENIRQTLFRQTQFAEFELRMYETAEQGKPLTGDVLTELYGEILKKYYGHDKGICHIDELYTVEWAYIPHFYSYYYVYQYSTSFTASVSLAERVIKQQPGAVDKYIEFLSSGGSDYPIDILKKAGVDLTTSQAFDQTMDSMVRTMDEVEKILDKKGM